MKLCKIESRTTSKFHDYPTVNESEIVVLLGQIWVYEKKRVLREKEGRTNLGGRERERRNIL